MRKIGIRQTEVVSGVALALALSACNSFDDPPSQDPNQPRLVIPVDEREALTSSVRPTAISGGTLTVLADGSAVVVSDPERDTISLVDLNTLTVRQTVKLQAGDEPGRSVEDADKRIHVALRGGGAIAVIDTISGSLVERRSACKSPRGVAFEASTGQVHVACAEGKLVSLAAKDGAVMRTLSLDSDLRDVLVRGGELWVTRFKSAEMLRIGSSTGTLDKRSTLPRSLGMLSKPPSKSAQSFEESTTKDVTIEPGVAWRAVSAPSGGAVIVHQQAVVDEIELSEPSTQGSAYGGGGFDCSGIVKNAISTVAPDGTVVTTTLQGAPLPVDIAVSANWVAVAHAGPVDFEAPRPFLEFPQSGGDVGPTASGAGPAFGNTVSIISQGTLSTGSRCAFSEGFVPLTDPAIAVAFAPNDKLLVQTRQPAQLVVISDFTSNSFSNVVSLSAESRFDTGHEIFHRDAGGGIACASCHPEGGEDGKTWRFAGTGERRTQALHVGLRDTAPFHWNGDLANVGSLMSEVFVGRMGGVRESEARLATLSEWLFSIKAPPAIRDLGDAAVTRGRDLFNSPDVGCATCHSGAKLTNNESVSIDSVATAKLQVPSLVAVGYRAPFMHTGCAATLTARFDPACGGNLHGNTAGLSEAQIGDLVAYLEAL